MMKLGRLLEMRRKRKRQQDNPRGCGGSVSPTISLSPPNSSGKGEISICLSGKVKELNNNASSSNDACSLHFYSLINISTKPYDDDETDRIIEPDHKTSLFQHYEHHHHHDKPPPTPLQLMQKLELASPTSYADDSLFAVLGSKVYRIGGVHYDAAKYPIPLSTAVSCFDVNRPHKGWRSTAPMISGRSGRYSRAVALHGKLYVFGGRQGRVGRGHFAEVYNPCPNKGERYWTPLPRPPRPLFDTVLCGIVLDSTTVLVGGNNVDREPQFHCYNVFENRWVGELDDLNYLLSFSRPQPVVVGTTIYWIDHNLLMAYDVHNHKVSRGRIDYDLPAPWWCCPDPTRGRILHHLDGDLFCLLWTDFREPNQPTVVHCTKFRVSRDSFDSLTTCAESCRCYIFPGSLGAFLFAYQLI